jgi:RNA polymerase sigma-70 factor (ECF subfamily)
MRIGVIAMTDFRQRLEEEIPRLRRYARALTTDASRADDLVHDTLVRALAKQHLWQPGTDLRAWLFTLMHNQNVNHIRRAIREGTSVDIEQVASLTANSDPSSSRMLFELRRALHKLPEGQRQLVLLVGLEGLSYEQAAEMFRIPVGTVRSRLSRGREALRELMAMNEASTAPTRETAAPRRAQAKPQLRASAA